MAPPAPAPSPAELRSLCDAPVTTRLTPEQFGLVLAHDPFVDVEGTFNVRDIGRLPREGSAPASGRTVRPGFAFRSGMLNHLTPKGHATLTDTLGIRRIFDLRSESEHASAPDPLPADGPVTVVWLETAEKSPNVSLEPFVAGYGEAAFADMYLAMLQAYRPTIRALLTHVRDRPHEPFLFHCTAGRDRTGVMAGLLLALVGEQADVIVLDYLLSRIGNEPVRDQLEAFARAGAIAPLKKIDLDVTKAGEGAPAVTSESDLPPGFVNLLTLRAQCWEAFQTALAEAYPGGYLGYVQSLGFSEADVATIRKNLTTAP